MDLRDALSKLPEREPRPDAWARLDADLRADALIDRALTELPQHEPRSDAWATIAAHLPKNNVAATVVVALWGNVVRPLWAAGARAAVAAVLTLVAGWWALRSATTLPGPAAGERVTTVYSVEPAAVGFAEGAGANAPTNRADARLSDFLAERCQAERTVCQKPEVRELTTQLRELDNRRAQVAEQLRVFGNDPALVRAQIKLENEHADVAKALVRILTI